MMSDSKYSQQVCVRSSIVPALSITALLKCQPSLISLGSSTSGDLPLFSPSVRTHCASIMETHMQASDKCGSWLTHLDTFPAKHRHMGMFRCSCPRSDIEVQSQQWSQFWMQSALIFFAKMYLSLVSFQRFRSV